MRVESRKIRCPKCSGEGHVYIPVGPDFASSPVECELCGSTGIVDESVAELALKERTPGNRLMVLGITVVAMALTLLIWKLF